MPASRTRSALRIFAATFAAFGALAGSAQATELRGVQLHSLWGGNSTDDINRDLDLSAQAGSNVVRVDVGWSALEQSGKGRYSQWYVDRLDTLVNGASARGMKVIATLWGSPCWASSAPDSIKQDCEGAWWDRGVTQYPPTNDADYADAARWMTARYGTKLTALEIWNEPNLPADHFWVASDEAGRYAALVKATYATAKQGNPNVAILAGALADADGDFLQALYAHGIKGYYDGISIHPYNENRAPDDLWQPKWRKYALLPGTRWVRDVQQANGDSAPLWLTEFGWTTATGSSWYVSETTQATYLAAAFPIIASLPYVKAAVVYNLRERGNDNSDFNQNFGVVNHDFSPKPAYHALRSALTGGSVSTDSGSADTGTTDTSAAHSSGTGIQAAAVDTAGGSDSRAYAGRVGMLIRGTVYRGRVYLYGKVYGPRTVRALARTFVLMRAYKGGRASPIMITRPRTISGLFVKRLGSRQVFSGARVRALALAR